MLQTAHYRIKHRTLYRYSAPVAICQNQLRMMPRSRVHHQSRIECHHVNTSISPAPDLAEQHEDYFGNIVYSFTIESPHRELDVNVESEVTVSHQADGPALAETSWQQVVGDTRSFTDPRWHEVNEYLFDSPLIRRGGRFADYALASFKDGRDIATATLELTERINHDFRYDQKATDVKTSPEEAFQLKAGVCQDFAQIQIACLRSLGIPARYISGYLRTHPPAGQPRLVGTDESHAWVSVYQGHQIGWVDVDPTNACPCNINHIPICIGRDYSEVSPMRGVALGGGKTLLRVTVDVDLIPET